MQFLELLMPAVKCSACFAELVLDSRQLFGSATQPSLAERRGPERVHRPRVLSGSRLTFQGNAPCAGFQRACLCVRGPSPRDVIRFHTELRVGARWRKQRRVRVRVQWSLLAVVS